MSEEKTITEDKKVVKTAKDDDNKIVAVKDEKKEEEKEVSLEVEKDESGLEQLPEDIMKKFRK